MRRAYSSRLQHTIRLHNFSKGVRDHMEFSPESRLVVGLGEGFWHLLVPLVGFTKFGLWFLSLKAAPCPMYR